MADFDSAKYTRDDLINAVKASPQAVAKHDKQGWLALFSKEGVIEDPVGTAPHRRIAGDRNDIQLDRFYETFIAPNEISFQVFQDIVAGNMVVRDVNIEIKLSTGLVTSVPTYILYELTEENGQLKVSHLAAHWELRRMVSRVMAKGLSGVKTMTVLGVRMLRIQGLKGIWGYMKGFTGVGKSGKRGVLNFVTVVNSRNERRLARLFEHGDVTIEFPRGGDIFDQRSFLDHIEAPISVSDLISAGRVTAFRIEFRSSKKGIGLFGYDSKCDKITKAQFFF